MVIDLLAVYTPGAATDDGGDAHLQQLIQESVDSVNQAMINSQISVTIRLVHIESINYTSSGDLYTDRTRLETNGDGYMDSIFALRNQYGADLVTLITDSGGGTEGGNADLMTDINDPNDPNLAFSAIDYASIGPGNLTMAHELGHNLGAGHERNNPTDPVVGAFPYSYGYRFSVNQPGVLQASFNDIMSYAYDMDIPLFQYANPNLSIAGVPTGLPPSDPNSADLYDTFLQTAPIVASYRSTVVSDTAAPTATLFETNRVGSSLTFTIRYGDDSGVDLSTIDNGDITVSGPGGFVLPATFVSMNSPSVNGAYKFATYHVTLPASNPATNSLTFNLLPNAIKDIHGNVATAGAIAQYTGYYAGSPFEASATYASYQWAEPLSSDLTAGATFTEYGSLGPDDLAHYYSFTLTQSATVEVNLSGLSADCNLYVTSDTNHDDLDDDTNLTYGNGGNSGTGPEDVALTLAAGTYYIHVDQPTPVQTGYMLTVRAGAVDTTPPTAVADTEDLRTSGAPYVDFAVTYSDDFDFDGVSARFDAAVDIHAVNGNYTFYYYPDYNINPYYYADGQNITIYYRINGPSGGFTSAYNDTYVLSVHDPGAGNPAPQDAAGNKLPLITLGSFKIDIGNNDTTPPTATLSAAPPITGMATWTFDVNYQDGSGIDTNTFDNGDIKVTGPGGYNQLATFVSATQPTTIGGTEIATYSVNAPGGYWDSTDDGDYTVAVQAGQVKDNAGNSIATTSFSPITASDPALTSLGGVSGVEFNGTSAGDTMRVDSDSSFVYFNLNDSTLYFVPKSSVPRFTINSLAGDDMIDYQSGTLTGSVVGGTGNNSLNVTGGTLTLDADGGASSSVLTISVTSPGSLIFSATQHLAGLTLGASTNSSITAGGGKVVITKALSLASTATFDVNDDGLVLDYTGSTPITSIRGLIQTGYNAGAWNGFGLSSTAARNDSSKSHDLGYAEASALGVSTFMGQAVDSTSILIQYTLSGNANLDQVVDVADLLAAAKNWQQTGKVYSQGDFNYDGKVDASDLKILAADWGKTTSGVSMAPLLGSMPLILSLSPPPPPPVRNSSISGSVFNDVNNNKKRDKHETGLSGWRVFIDSNNDGILDDGERSAVTDAKGNWTIKGLAAATYTLRIVPKAHWSGTTPKNNAFTIALKSGAAVTGKRFGETRKA